MFVAFGVSRTCLELGAKLAASDRSDYLVQGKITHSRLLDQESGYSLTRPLWSRTGITSQREWRTRRGGEGGEGGGMSKTYTLTARTSTKTECDCLHVWIFFLILKTVTFAKIFHPKTVGPRDLAGNVEEKEGPPERGYTACYGLEPTTMYAAWREVSGPLCHRVPLFKEIFYTVYMSSTITITTTL